MQAPIEEEVVKSDEGEEKDVSNKKPRFAT